MWNAILCLPLLIIFLGVYDNTSSSWKVTAQQRRSTSRQPRPSLHNQKHEATIRNILLPRFKQQSSSTTSSSHHPPLIQGNHTSNVAIIVSSSRYWFNYRHVTNALSIYHLLKRGGITDDNIILMLADDMPCNQRNTYRGKIYPRGTNNEDLMENVEIDYTGTDVTVDAFLRVLLGRHLPGEEFTYSTNNKNGKRGIGKKRSWPRINENTNVLVYLTGHGGDNFFKFQDGEELMSNDIASVFSQMYEMKRYNEILFISDTCQAFTMADEISVPNVFSVGSSLKGQNSYASHSDIEVGQSVIDRYSKIIKDFVDDAVTLTSDPSSTSRSISSPEGLDEATVAVMERLNLYDALVRIPMNHGDLGPNSQVGHTDHSCSRAMNGVPLSDFFAAPSMVREQGKINRGGVKKSSLWMVNKSHDEGQGSRGEATNECEVEEDGELSSMQNTNNRDEWKEKEPKVKGMSPFDPAFLAMLAGFVLCINVLSRTW